MILRIAIFLLLNFLALALGGLFTTEAVQSDWYYELQKAPWTPPGWVFGFAWTTIMCCFSFYMAYLWPAIEEQKMLVSLFVFQWVLNVSWNPVFFYFHKVGFAMILILILTALIGFFLFQYWPFLRWKSAFIFPYLLWLLIACTLNGYILFKN